MADSLFDLFGDHLTRQAVKNVTRQPLLFGNENRGKGVFEGPIKPNEPKKKVGEPKKSFLSNTGKALQSTPARQMFSPRAMNVNIYIEDKDKEELEFTKPTHRNLTHCELFDSLPRMAKHVSPPATPPPKTQNYGMEHEDCSFNDNSLDFSMDSLLEDDLGHPALF